MWTRNQAEEVLKVRFGMMDGFRKGQWEILSSALEGRDVMAVLPTGGGKSICFQLFAVLAKKLVVVVLVLNQLLQFKWSVKL
jgi:ATP-dependent DNA helicase RecQ